MGLRIKKKKNKNNHVPIPTYFYLFNVPLVSVESPTGSSPLTLSLDRHFSLTLLDALSACVLSPHMNHRSKTSVSLKTWAAQQLVKCLSSKSCGVK